MININLLKNIKKHFFTLTTDFGNSEYSGVLKGIIYSKIPDAKIIDITHNIKAQNIKSAAYIIKTTYNYFPENTVHICVIDPGVGSNRNICFVKTNKYFFIGPDNGIFSYIKEIDETSIFYKIIDIEDLIETPKFSTFHARDIFTPLAILISKEIDIKHHIQILKDPILFKKTLKIDKNSISSTILHKDTFGNLITEIEHKHIQNKKIKNIFVNNKKIDSNIFNFYSEAPDNKPFLLIGSSGHIELAIKGSNAAQLFNEPIIKIEFF